MLHFSAEVLITGRMALYDLLAMKYLLFIEKPYNFFQYYVCVTNAPMPLRESNLQFASDGWMINYNHMKILLVYISLMKPMLILSTEQSKILWLDWN